MTMLFEALYNEDNNKMVCLSSRADDRVDIPPDETKFERHRKELYQKKATSQNNDKIDAIKALLERRKVKW